MGKKNPDCSTCIYRAVNRAWKCNYETVTGHTRKAVPASRCADYREGNPEKNSPLELLEKLRRAEKEEKKRKPRGVKEKYDWDIAKRLYDEGKNDGEIARVMGCTPGVVRQWRNRNKLPANATAGWRARPAKHNWDLAMKLYQEGKSDGEVGREMGCSGKVVANWRRRQGLKANKPQGWKGSRKNDAGRDSERTERG